MIKQVIKETDDRRVVNMYEMKPLQIGIIVDSNHHCCGNVVMRTASADKFEVMDLTKSGIDNCWNGRNRANIKVKLFKLGEKKVFVISNDE